MPFVCNIDEITTVYSLKDRLICGFVEPLDAEHDPVATDGEAVDLVLHHVVDDPRLAAVKQNRNHRRAENVGFESNRYMFCSPHFLHLPEGDPRERFAMMNPANKRIYLCNIFP